MSESVGLEASPGPSLSLEEAIRDKYCCPDAEETVKDGVNESALGYKPGGCPVDKLSNVVLDSKGVSRVKDVQDLTQLCPRVKDLHLPYNQIHHHRDVDRILCAMPDLKVLDLSHNPLHSSTFVSNGHLSTRHLSTLVLTGTAINWQAVQVFLMGLNQLQEVHLSINSYRTVALPDTFQHSTIQRLHFNENLITEWAELAKLSHAFPNLRTLIACGNPIQEIPELPPDLFPSLQTLNLNDCALCSWPSLEHLHALGKLVDLSVMKIPLGKDMDQKKRRNAFVARLPNVVKLNKSIVNEREREAAERWLIRELSGTQDLPAIYQTLVVKHGELNQLADIDLGAPREGFGEDPHDPSCVKMEFHFDGEDRPMEEREVNMNWTCKQFKSWIAKELLGMPSSSFGIWYHDKSWVHILPLKPNKTFLRILRLDEQTEIHIRMK